MAKQTKATKKVVTVEELDKVSEACGCDEIDYRILVLEEKMENLYKAFAHLVSETGAGRILVEYNIKKHDVTKEELNIGKFKLAKKVS